MARKGRKKSGIGLFAALLLMIVIAGFIYKSSVTPGNEQLLENKYDDKPALNSSFTLTPNASEKSPAPVSPSKEPEPSVSISPDALNSPNAILLNLKDQTILMQKNSEEKIYPASLTKMMTAIVAIENLPDLKLEIKLTNSTFQGL